MRIASSLRPQVGLLVRVGFVLGVPVGVAFGALYAITRAAGIPFSSLSRDPSATYGYPWYGGSVSLIGVLIASGAGIVALVGAWLVGRQASRLASMLRWFGAGMVVFALDDGFMLHEEVLPFWIGIPEVVAISAYGVWASVLALRFHQSILADTDFGLLGAGLVLLALQGALDTDINPIPLGQAALEDPIKIVALILLLVYALRTLSGVRVLLVQESEGRDPTSGRHSVP